MPTAGTTTGIAIAGLVKRYGDTRALAGLSLQARPGEILGVAGPNGAGKSTLVKVLAGEVVPDEGTVTLDGQEWSADSITEANRVAVVHQEPALFPNLSVSDNILVGQEPSRFLRPAKSDVDQEVLREAGLLPYADRTVDTLPLALQQRTEIARALAKRADVFLFDEPNSALTENESRELFDRMHELASQGKVIFLVSHRLAELAAHCDRIAIVVDGAVRTELSGAEINEERIARELVVGRSGGESNRVSRTIDEEELLSLRGWSHRHARFLDVDLSVRRGEIVAVVGVEGSGGRELVRSVAGFEAAQGGCVLEGQTIRARSDAVAFVTGDRSESLFDNMSVAENLYVRQAGGLTSRTGVLRRGQGRVVAQRLRTTFNIKARDIAMPIRGLSGGNQQKVAIAAAIALTPRLVALEEPTRGVDLGSKAEIYRLLREFGDSGSAVLMYCTEDSEVFDAADRVGVMASGRLVGVLQVSDYDDAESLAETIARLAGTDALPEDAE